MRHRRFALAAAVVAGATACSPTLDWREVRPGAGGVSLLLPCKPNTMTRTVQLAGQAVQLSLHACSAGGQTWAIAFADVGEPGQVTPALVELRRAAATNLGAADDGPALPLSVAGATPNAAGGRSALRGRLPDGTDVQEQVAVFAHGTWVVQATVIGERLPAEGVDTFFSSLRAAR